MFWDCGKSHQDDPIVSPKNTLLSKFIGTSFEKNDCSTLFLPRIECSVLYSDDWENKIVKLLSDFSFKLWNRTGLYRNGEGFWGFENVLGGQPMLASESLVPALW